MNTLKRIPFHPFLLAIYPVLTLLANNLSEVEKQVALRPLVITLILAALILGLFYVITRDARKASLVASLFLVLFFSYGHLYDLLRQAELEVNMGRHVLLGPLYAVIFALGLWLILKKVGNASAATQALNLIVLLLLVFPLYQIVRSGVQDFSASNRDTAQNTTRNTAWEKWLQTTGAEIAAQPADASGLPDIYYIIPDMYARHDAILDDINYDNSDFLDELRQMGFYVARCSRSNYAQTRLSLVSSLNMDYLDAIGKGIEDENGLSEPLSDSLVRAELLKLGYKTVIFGSGFGLSEVSGSEYNFSPQQPPLFLMQIQPFEVMLIKSSAARILTDVRMGGLTSLMDTIMFPYNDHATVQNFILDKLEDVPSLPGPKFVFVHLMVPHPPFVFAPDGTLIKDDLYYREAMGLPSTEELFVEGYANQVAYLDSRLPGILETIISQSKRPPVIILQGDHGIRFQNRLQILNAYYLPDDGSEKLYKSISPINSFRVIFNTYFGSNLPLLEDRSYYSEYPDRFDLSLVPENASECLEAK